MTVKETVLETAENLGLEREVKEYLDGSSTDGKRMTENLVRCFNLVENELALDYLPLVEEEEWETETGVVYFSELSRKAVRIVKVSDRRGNDIPYALFPEYLKTQTGRVKIRYSYTPEEKSITDSSDFLLYASVRLFAYGMAAEYCLASGLFEEASVWDKKYKDAISAIYRVRPAKKIQSRRWV